MWVEYVLYLQTDFLCRGYGGGFGMTW